MRLRSLSSSLSCQAEAPAAAAPAAGGGCVPGRQASVGAVGGGGERAGPAGRVALGRPAHGVAGGSLRGAKDKNLMWSLHRQTAALHTHSFVM